MLFSDEKALRMDVAMIVAFILAVNGCALYTLKRVRSQPGSRLFWAAVILCVPIGGALIFFFFRPRDPIKYFTDDSIPEKKVGQITPVDVPIDKKLPSMTPPTTPTLLHRFAAHAIKSPDGTLESPCIMYAPSS
ncbi:hypothetical protein Naga_100001g60 [Nannochloropsis gaditana]|uniref:Cardiolipin synthase N-terminal domain-containing protein n=1 Tax=Nannochloropsis gaditana TaxID=72520 RepID=W7TT04_9STRA|nr:hypothetical protein Naga_100001g60 [Nannochloropsis gaditana]